MLDIRKLVFCSVFISAALYPKQLPAQVSPSAPAAQEETASKKNQNEDSVKNETYWNKVISPEVLPVWLSAVGTLLAVIAAGFTLRVIYDQARYGRIAAEAALLNAQALINAERPWLMIQIDKEDKPSRDDDRAYAVFHLKVFNYGKSPAHVSCVRTREDYFLDPEKDPIVPPDYGKAVGAQNFIGPNIDSNGFWTVDPNDDFSVMNRGISAGNAGVPPEDMKLVVWGLIEYGDGVSAKTYETAFCYRYRRTPTEIKLVMSGPKEYNRYT